MEWNMDSVEPLADAIPVLFILSFNVSLFITFFVACVLSVLQNFRDIYHDTT